jgi:hypothetical protein
MNSQYFSFNQSIPYCLDGCIGCVAIAFAEEVTVRLDLMDREDKKMGFTVLKGDPRFKLYTATMQFMDGPRGNTTTAVWKVIYITVGDEDVPPIHVKNMVVTVWETLASAVNADPELYSYYPL